MNQYLDIAVNLIGSHLEQDLNRVINEAADEGVSPLILIGSHLDESRSCIQVCRQYPKKIYTTAGVHPHHASQWQTESATELRQLARQPGVVAVGECGLDYNRDFSPRRLQRQAFEAQLTLAAELQYPVLMHQRDAHDDFLAILDDYLEALPAALLHCFTDGPKQAEDYIARDLYLGVTGWVCDERRGLDLVNALPLIPDNRLLLETDSPYLLPRSMRPKPKSGRNEPKYLPYIAQAVADIRGQSLDSLARQCYSNSLRFFKLESTHG